MRVLVIRKTSIFAQYSKAATFQSFSDLAAGWGLPPKRARTLRVSSIGDRSVHENNFQDGAILLDFDLFSHLSNFLPTPRHYCGP
jgi:hypothetical protein